MFRTRQHLPVESLRRECGPASQPSSDRPQKDHRHCICMSRRTRIRVGVVFSGQLQRGASTESTGRKTRRITLGSRVSASPGLPRLPGPAGVLCIYRTQPTVRIIPRGTSGHQPAKFRGSSVRRGASIPCLSRPATDSLAR